MSFLTFPAALLSSMLTSFGHSRRYEHLFSLSDVQLKNRGLEREPLVRSYILGFAYS